MMEERHLILIRKHSVAQREERKHSVAQNRGEENILEK
jgi:hypothetical protein